MTKSSRIDPLRQHIFFTEIEYKIKIPYSLLDPFFRITTCKCGDKLKYSLPLYLNIGGLSEFVADLPTFRQFRRIFSQFFYKSVKAKTELLKG